MGVIEEKIKHLGSSGTDSRFDFQCGHCGRDTSGRVVSHYLDGANTPQIKFLLCTSCTKGSVWIRPDIIYPGVNPGDNLEGLPTEVNDAYEEARTCFAVNAFTASDLLCRKILMHIGVDKGAEEGKSFEFYLDYLESEGYITPPIKTWADIIRKNGNSSTHKLEKPDKEKAENTLMFTMQLLRIIYEMDFKANKYNSPKEEQ